MVRTKIIHEGSEEVSPNVILFLLKTPALKEMITDSQNRIIRIAVTMDDVTIKVHTSFNRIEYLQEFEKRCIEQLNY